MPIKPRIRLAGGRKTTKPDTTSTNKVVPDKKTTTGKSVARSGQKKGLGDASVFKKRMTKAPSKLVSPVKSYVKRPRVLGRQLTRPWRRGS